MEKIENIVKKVYCDGITVGSDSAAKLNYSDYSKAVSEIIAVIKKERIAAIKKCVNLIKENNLLGEK